MKYVANDDKVEVGERVVTSGMDRIFPRDLAVGTVAEIKSGNPFKTAFACSPRQILNAWKK